MDVVYLPVVMKMTCEFRKLNRSYEKVQARE